MSYEMIRVENVGAVRRIVLNRPERLNACPPSMAVEISDALYDLEGARAVLITGEGRAFCSGADLAASGARSIAGGAGSVQGAHRELQPDDRQAFALGRAAGHGGQWRSSRVWAARSR